MFTGSLLKNSRNFLLIIIIAQILLHLPFLDNPPMGQHTWRQVMGLAPARNYYEENNSFLYPSQDIRIEKDDHGVTYFEFPLVYWLIGQSYHATGFNHINGRAWMLLFGVLLIIGAFKFIKALGFDEAKAKWYVFFLSCSPYFFYYSISVSPNLPALAWYTWGLSFLIPALKSKKWTYNHILAPIFLTLGIISKSTYLFFGLPLAYLFIFFWLRNRRASLLLFCVLTLGVIFSSFGFLYAHMQELAKTTPWERLIHLVREPYPFPNNINDILKVVRFSFNEWFLQLFVNSGAMFFFFTGLYQAIKKNKVKTFAGGFWVAWGVSFFVFYLLFFRQFREHSYYQTPLLLFAPAASAYGIQFFLKHTRWKYAAYILVVLIPIIMVGRTYKRWTVNKQVPIELLDQSETFQKIIPEKDRVLVFGDNSPMIYLYYLHRKGVVGSSGMSEALFNRYKSNGYKWVVNEKGKSDISNIQLQLTLKDQIGAFEVYQIK